MQYLPLQNKLLGKGAYGHVCAVTNSENGERLAVKKVKNAFEDVIDAKRVLREIRELPPRPSHLSPALHPHPPSISPPTLPSLLRRSHTPSYVLIKHTAP